MTAGHACRVYREREQSGARVDEYRDTPNVGDRQIRHAIAIEVAHRQGEEAVGDAHTEGTRRLEGPIAVAQQDRHGAGSRVRHREVWPAIAVEVTDGHRDREIASSEGQGRL